ncbi:hypothetical protein AVEN_122765-1 [Araneus ventricosus]|uniref:Uncharacterized protein n=1 Tax=Araneus ventricosus TaxID=182803 RepID=A0A4Y2GWW2_ARAVE|nr:hypothetical protein AVEN_122765-1 [Araneus ventricosus]
MKFGMWYRLRNCRSLTFGTNRKKGRRPKRILGSLCCTTKHQTRHTVLGYEKMEERTLQLDCLFSDVAKVIGALSYGFFAPHPIISGSACAKMARGLSFFLALILFDLENDETH